MKKYLSMNKFLSSRRFELFLMKPTRKKEVKLEISKQEDIFAKILQATVGRIFSRHILKATPVNPVQIRGQKGLPTSFSPLISASVGISHQQFLIFSFNPFSILV